MRKSGLLLFIFTAISFTRLYGNEKDLDVKINMLSKEIEDIKYELFLIQDDISFFDLTTENKIDKINTNAGPLFIRVSGVLPSKDGYTATVYVGNPLTATLSDITLHVAWRSSKEWKEKKFSLPSQLSSSSWTPVNIQLSPVDSSDDLKSVAMSIEVGKVELVNK